MTHKKKTIPTGLGVGSSVAGSLEVSSLARSPPDPAESLGFDSSLALSVENEKTPGLEGDVPDLLPPNSDGEAVAAAEGVVDVGATPPNTNPPFCVVGLAGVTAAGVEVKVTGALKGDAPSDAGAAAWPKENLGGAAGVWVESAAGFPKVNPPVAGAEAAPKVNPEDAGSLGTSSGLVPGLRVAQAGHLITSPLERL